MSGNTIIALELLTRLLTQAHGLTVLLAKARSEERDVTETELDNLVQLDNVARENLDAAIKAAKEKQ